MYMYSVACIAGDLGSRYYNTTSGSYEKTVNLSLGEPRMESVSNNSVKNTVISARLLFYYYYFYFTTCGGDLPFFRRNRLYIRPPTNKHEHTSYFKFYLKKTMIIALK